MSFASLGEPPFSKNKLVFPDFPTQYPEHNVSIHKFEDREAWGVYNTHDPCGIKVGDTYYVFSTDAMWGYPTDFGGTPRTGIQVRRSKDLINWIFSGWVLPDLPDGALKYVIDCAEDNLDTKFVDDFREADPPRSRAKPGNVWAGPITKVGDEYRYYYSMALFGTTCAYTGLAVSTNIDGPWEDKGEVFTSSGPLDDITAIDGTPMVGPDGRHWFVIGGAAGGIRVYELDPETGFLLNRDDPGKLIVARSNNWLGMEGSHLVYRPDRGKYYIFLSYGYIDSTYNTRVGRSDSPEGPYLDYHGNDMAEPADNFPRLAASYAFANSPGWIAPGGVGTVENDEGDLFLLHHARPGDLITWTDLHVRKIYWSDDNWPLLSPQRYAGEKVQPVPADQIPGTWEVIDFTPKPTPQHKAMEDVKFRRNGRMVLEGIKGDWELSGENSLALTMNPGSRKVKGRVVPGWDWEQRRGTLLFTGLDEKGVAVWAKKN
jgi:arabinan endo-1,5-alpha-L-arabinosidase